MLKNNLRLIWRNLLKNKTFSLINIAGLAIGMAACILILEYVSFQLSYDQFNTKASDVYRVYNDRYQHGKLVQHGTITYSGVSPAMQSEFPEVVNHSRVEPNGGQIVKYADKKLEVQDVLFVEPSFMQMFDYPLLAGPSQGLLTTPGEVIISESLARRIFDYKGSDFSSLLGKMITIDRDSLPHTVTAICADVPENSHLKFEMLMPYMALNSLYHYKESVYDFTDSDFWHYIQLRHGTDYKAFEKKLPGFSQKFFQGSKVSGSDEKFYLQPLSRAHLYSDFEYEIGETSSATVVWGLLIVALFIILIAWVNYINLSTARSVDRAKEVGIRKVTGATRPQLIRQFLSEAVLINIVALGIGLCLVLMLQQRFNTLIGYDLSANYLFAKGLNGYTITVCLLSLIGVGILASGFYPSFVLSSFKPIMVLKGKFSASKKGTMLRRGLVVGQFGITVLLIIGSLVVYQQMKFVSHQELGMNIDQILLVKGPTLADFDSTYITRASSLRSELKNIPHVKGVATTDRPMGNEMGRAFDARRVGQDPSVHYTLRNFGVSPEFLDVYTIKLAAGRNFALTDYNYHFDKLHNTILNESAVKMLGFASADDAVGKSIMFFGRKWDVIGVIRDFHQKSLHFVVEPMVLIPTEGTYNPISIKVDPADLTHTIAAIKAKYDDFFPGNLFDYTFLDKRFNEQYKNDRLFGQVFGSFAGLAVFVACLGLLGLSLFATAQRVKEIGVRKVLGATVSQIVLLLSRDFVKLVLFAFVVAAPVAWYIMHRWLENFAYRIGISWWIFGAAGLLAVVVVLATISFQAVRAAVANPVKSLRTE